jgi:membrane-bound lytic murein transglycosylase
MAIENVQELLTEQLGKRRCDVVTTTAMTGKNYYCIHFPLESVVTVITAANVTAAAGSSVASLVQTYPAGTTLFLNVNTLTMTSGLALCYYEQPI